MLLSLLRIHERMTNEPRLFEVNKVLNDQLHYLNSSPEEILNNWNVFIGKSFLAILKEKAEHNNLTYQFVQNCLLTFMPLLKFKSEQIYEMTVFVLAECTKSSDRDRMALLREWVTYCCASTDYVPSLRDAIMQVDDVFSIIRYGGYGVYQLYHLLTHVCR